MSSPAGPSNAPNAAPEPVPGVARPLDQRTPCSTATCSCSASNCYGSAKYDVADEQGNKIVFVERPAHLLHNLCCSPAGGGICGSRPPRDQQLVPRGRCRPVRPSFVGSGRLLVVGVGLSAKRHIRSTATRRNAKTAANPAGQEVAAITPTYTIRDAPGRTLALLWKNYLYNLFRKRWYREGSNGQTLYVAMEDSIILSLLRASGTVVRRCGPISSSCGRVGGGGGRIQPQAHDSGPLRPRPPRGHRQRARSTYRAGAGGHAGHG